MRNHTWIVVQLQGTDPCGVMTNPTTWGSDYIGNAQFNWPCELNQKTTAEKWEGIIKSDSLHKMAKQTADRFATTLNEIRSIKDIARGITFRSVSIKDKPKLKAKKPKGKAKLKLIVAGAAINEKMDQNVEFLGHEDNVVYIRLCGSGRETTCLPSDIVGIELETGLNTRSQFFKDSNRIPERFRRE